MSGRSQLLALVVLVAPLAGCAPGFAVRGPRPVDIGAAPAPAAPALAPAAALGPGPAAGHGQGDDHEDEPALVDDPGADDRPDSQYAPVGLGGVPQATRYASLQRASCEAELGKRRIAFERVGEARGVIAPLRLKGPIGGIEFHSMLPLAQRKTSPYEIYDCRLVLALDDWARILARHDVVEVVHYSVYRPPPARQVLNGPGRRHSGALAIDAAIFKTRDGKTINVEKDFHGRIGGKPCAGRTGGATKNVGLPAEAVTLREIVCEAADAQLFNVMLTPDYNWPHRNHFHLEVTAGKRWVFVR